MSSQQPNFSRTAASDIITMLECRHRDWLSKAEYAECLPAIADIIERHAIVTQSAIDAERARADSAEAKLLKFTQRGTPLGEFIEGSIL